METLKQLTPKARKDHKCDYCQRIIKKGEVYNKSTHVAYGDMYDWKSHQHCAELASDLRWFDECDEGLTSDDFQEHVRNAFQDINILIDNDFYESRDFKYPKFELQLQYVIVHKKRLMK